MQNVYKTASNDYFDYEENPNNFLGYSKINCKLPNIIMLARNKLSIAKILKIKFVIEVNSIGIKKEIINGTTSINIPIIPANNPPRSFDNSE